MALSIVPQVWEPFIANSLTYLNNIQNQGLVSIVTNAAITAGDVTWRNPKLKSLNELAADDVQLTTSTTLSPQALTDYQELYPVLHRADGISIHDLNKIEMGVDAMQMLAPQIAQRNLNQMQKKLVSFTKGAFATVLATSHTHDKSNAGITPMAIYEAGMTIHGEAMTLLNKVIMHSKIFYDLQASIEQKLTVNADSSTLPAFYLGDKRVIINDTLCAPASGVYPTYICGGSPWVIGYQKSLALETYRSPLTFTDSLQWTVHYAVGLTGVSMTSNNSNPTPGTLETGSNYTSVAPTVNSIPLVRLLTL
jgi:hypothetical protein